MEETIRIQEKEYWLTVESEGHAITISVVGQDQKGVVIKLRNKINIFEDAREMSCFGTGAEIVKYLQKRQNYLLSLPQGIFEIYWQINGQGYSKEMKHAISLHREEATKLQTLEFENMLLKQTIETLHKDPKFLNREHCNYVEQKLEDSPQQANQIEQNIKLQKSIDVGIKIQQPAQIIAAISFDAETVLMSEESDSLSKIIKAAKPKRKTINKRKKTRKSKQNKQNKQTLDTFLFRKKQNEEYFHQEKRKQEVKKQQQQKSERKLRKLRKITQQEEDQYKLEANEEEDIFQDNQTQIKNEVATEPSRQKKKYAKRIKQEEVERGTIIVGNRTRIDYNNGDYYLGEISNGKYHGYGIYSAQDKGVYEGEWVNGFAEGKGASIDIQGNRHSGRYRLDRKHGLGVDEYINRDRYEGEFENDCKQGVGTYYFISGDKYEGQWKDNVCHGRGTETYADGSSYTGSWKNDEKDGEGVFTNQYGFRFKQLWKSGILINQVPENKND